MPKQQSADHLFDYKKRHDFTTLSILFDVQLIYSINISNQSNFTSSFKKTYVAIPPKENPERISLFLYDDHPLPNTTPVRIPAATPMNKAVVLSMFTNLDPERELTEI